MHPAGKRIRAAVTISLVPQARGGPFVFWDDLPGSCRSARELGFDAVELFLPSSDAVDPGELRRVLDDCELSLAAVGTGAGWVLQRLQLCDPAPARRRAACEYVTRFIEFGASFGAPAIVGSMQGRAEGAVTHDMALGWLGEALGVLGERAGAVGGGLLIEPLNRYETNLLNRVEQVCGLIEPLSGRPIRVLADLFHMNIEERSIPEALRTVGGRLGHVHFVDSNRNAAGLGHLEYGPIIEALRGMDYGGYLSAEARPEPTPEAAARQTRSMITRWFG